MPLSRAAARRRRIQGGRALTHLAAWDQPHPGPDVHRSLFNAYYQPPRDERPAHVRYCGPLATPRIITDPSILRAEARRMLDVAATLEALQQAFPAREKIEALTLELGP